MRTELNDAKRAYEALLKEIEAKINRGSAKEWSDSTFQLLNAEIENSSGTSISTQTLKRVYGKISRSKDYMPNEATLDALALYAGHDNWGAYLASSRKSQWAMPKVGVMPLLAVLAIGIGAMFYFFWSPRKVQVSLTPEKGVYTQASRTISFHYDISNDGDEYYLSVDGKRILLAPDKHRAALFIRSSGYFKAYIEQGQEKLDSAHVLITTSSDWFSYVIQNDEILFGISDAYYNGYLNIPRELAMAETDSNTHYLQEHRCFKAFQLDSKNMEGHIAFRNNKFEGSKAPFTVTIQFYFERGNIDFIVNGWRYHAQNEIRLGSQIVQGRFDDLSYLSFKEEETKEVRFHSSPDSLWVYTDQRKCAYPKPDDLGLLRGCLIQTIGNGKIDRIQLKDAISQAAAFTFDFEGDKTESDFRLVR